MSLIWFLLSVLMLHMASPDPVIVEQGVGYMEGPEDCDNEVGIFFSSGITYVLLLYRFFAQM